MLICYYGAAASCLALHFIIQNYDHNVRRDGNANDAIALLGFMHVPVMATGPDHSKKGIRGSGFVITAALISGDMNNFQFISNSSPITAARSAHFRLDADPLEFEADGTISANMKSDTIGFKA
eukprot:scaffold417257_cov20-Prasinocladus_malaysianus.AAC.2